MKLDLYRSLWGVDVPHADFFPTVKAAGYAGIETRGPAPEGRDTLRRLLADHGLSYIGMLFTDGASPAEHFDSFRAQVEALHALGARQVTAHSGRDDWSFAQAVEFYTRVAEWEAAAPIPVGHETHRGRVFFNPWITRDVLREVPNIKLCIDYSHWVCVAERLLDDADPILALCAERALHLHTRVGYEEGPQVPDPGAPEYERHLLAHERLWKRVFSTQQKLGRTTMTATPEFGPPGYLHTLPHTNVPVADLARVIDWSAKRLRTVLGLGCGPTTTTRIE